MRISFSTKQLTFIAILALLMSAPGTILAADALPLTPEQYEQKRAFFIDAMSSRLGQDPEGIGRAAAAALMTQHYLVLKRSAQLWEERKNDATWREQLPQGGDGFLRMAHDKYRQYEQHPEAFRKYFQAGMNRYEEKVTLARTGKLPDFMGAPFDYIQVAGGAVGLASAGWGFGIQAAAALAKQPILDAAGRHMQGGMIDQIGEIPSSAEEYMGTFHDDVEQNPFLREALDPWIKSYLRVSIGSGPLEMAQVNLDIAEERLTQVRAERAERSNVEQDARLKALEQMLEINRARSEEVLQQVRTTGSAVLELKREQEYAAQLVLAQGKYIEHLLKEREQDELRNEIRALEREALHEGLSLVTTGMRLAGGAKFANTTERFMQRGIALSDAFAKAGRLDDLTASSPELMKGNELTADFIRGANVALFAIDFVNMMSSLESGDPMLEAIRRQFAIVTEQMHARFDRVDESLANIYEAIASESIENQKTQAEVLKRLDAIMSNVASVERRMVTGFARLEDKIDQTSLQERMATLIKCLNYQRQRRTALPADDFGDCIDYLYAGAIRARSVPQGVALEDKDAIVQRALRNDVHSEIEGLSAIAADIGFQHMAQGEIRAPVAWQFYVDAYLLMATTYPNHYAKEYCIGLHRKANQPTQIDDMIEVGRDSIEAVARLGGDTEQGMRRLFDDYVQALKAVKSSSVRRRCDLENMDLPRSGRNLGGFDTAKPINQSFPHDKPHKMYGPYEVAWSATIRDKRRPCSFDYFNADSKFSVSGVEQFIPPAFLLAENLGLGSVTPCVLLSHTDFGTDGKIGVLIVGEYYPADKTEPAGHVFRRMIEFPTSSVPKVARETFGSEAAEWHKTMDKYHEAIQSHIDAHFAKPDSEYAFDPATGGFEAKAERFHNVTDKKLAQLRRMIEMKTASRNYDTNQGVPPGELLEAFEIAQNAEKQPVLTFNSLFAELNPQLQSLRAEVTAAVASDIDEGQLTTVGGTLTRAHNTAQALIRLGWNDNVRRNGVFQALFHGTYRLPTHRDLAEQYRRAAGDAELGFAEGRLLDPIANRKYTLQADTSKEAYDAQRTALKQDLEMVRTAGDDVKEGIRMKIAAHSKQLEDMQLTEWVQRILPYAEPALSNTDFAERVGWEVPKLAEIQTRLRGQSDVTSEELLLLKLAAFYQLVIFDLPRSHGGEYAGAQQTLKMLEQFKRATDDPLYPLICQLSGPISETSASPDANLNESWPSPDPSGQSPRK